MVEIQTKLVTLWTKAQRDKPRTPIYIDVDCPSCGKSLVGFKLDFAPMNYREVHHARVACMACGTQAHLFLVNWDPENDPDNKNARLYIDPTPQLNLPIPSLAILRAFSPKFIAIYQQAAMAEQLGLDELVGMGYRKALEFLVKDYAILQHPTEEANITKTWLKKCIEEYITDDEIRACAEETAELGNNETHYERRAQDGDIEDLKEVLHLTAGWIASKLKTKEIQTRRQQKKQGKTV
jgi:hypothetical protein